jgi:hypothetical protein
MKMSMERWWKDNDWKTEVLKKTLTECQLVCQGRTCEGSWVCQREC